MNIQNNIIQYVLSNYRNKRFIVEDGINTSRLIIDKINGIFEKNIFEPSDIKKINPNFAKTISIIKNLDEYQYLLGQAIPELDDNNLFKLDLLKSRIYIFYVTSIIVYYLKNSQFEKIVEWNQYANTLLEKISDFYVDFTNNDLNRKLDFGNISKHFCIDEDFINNTLNSCYN